MNAHVNKNAAKVLKESAEPWPECAGIGALKEHLASDSEVIRKQAKSKHRICFAVHIKEKLLDVAFIGNFQRLFGLAILFPRIDIIIIIMSE